MSLPSITAVDLLQSDATTFTGLADITERIEGREITRRRAASSAPRWNRDILWTVTSPTSIRLATADDYAAALVASDHLVL